MRQTSWLSSDSRRQYAKESEESFADKLQLLARKVISKKPDFRVNLDNTMKQQYASQLYTICSNASIAKALLLQMPTGLICPVSGMSWLEFLELVNNQAKECQPSPFRLHKRVQNLRRRGKLF